MNWLYVLLVTLILVPIGVAKDKKRPAPPVEETYPTSLVLSKSCDVIWPSAISALMDAGMQISSSDKLGGLVTFKASSEFSVESVNTGFRNRPSPTETLFRSLTIKHPGATVYGYRIPSGTMAVMPDGDHCKCQVSIQIVGLFDLGYHSLVAVPLQTSGKLEYGWLSGIESKSSR
jgi:hypothetical protein